MNVDMRIHPPVRDQVHAGLVALNVQARQIWGGDKLALRGVVLRLTVGVGDLARLARDHGNILPLNVEDGDPVAIALNSELKKELGNVLFSTIRWIDDLGLDVLECLDLAIEAQEKFAGSGRPR